MANKPTQPVFPLGLVAEEQSTLAGVLNTGTIEHGPDAVLTLPEGNASAGLPSSVRYNADSDEFEGFYENGGWLPLGGGGIRWEVLPHASTATLTEGRGYLINNTTGASTVVLPSPTRIGDSVTICDAYGKFATYPLTVSPSGNNLYGSTEDMAITTDNVSATFTWSGPEQGWIITSGVGLGQGRVYSREIFTKILASETSTVNLNTPPTIVDVYADGKRLAESKYSLDGNVITFSPSLPANTELQVIEYTPIQLGNGGGSDSSTITWVYNGGSAIGGETEITLDVVVDDVPAIDINGSRQYKNLGFTFDPLTSKITLAQELEPEDEVVVIINGTPNIYNQIDYTLREVARVTNVKDTEVVYFSVGAVLSGYKVIYDKETQRAYPLPADIAPGTTAVSLSSSAVLVHSAGSVDLGELAVSREEYVTLSGSFATGVTVNTKNELVVFTDGKYRWDGALPKVVSAGSTPTISGGIGLGAWVSVGDVSLRSNLASANNELGDSLITVKQPFEGSILRTQHDKNSDYVNVKDFGAIGDGITDDTTAIKSAIAYAGTIKGVVYFPDGSYKISSTLALPSNVSIIGRSRESVTITKTTSDTVTVLVTAPTLAGGYTGTLPTDMNAVICLGDSGSSRWSGTIAGVTLYGAKTTTENHAVEFGIVNAGVVSDSKIEDVYIYDCKYGLVLPVIFASQVGNNRFTACLGGVFINNGTSCVVSTNYSNSCRDYGHWYRDLKYSVIEANACDNTNRNDYYPDRTRVCYGYVFQNLLGVTVTGNGQEGTLGINWRLDNFDHSSFTNNTSIRLGSDYTGPSNISWLELNGVARNSIIENNVSYEYNSNGMLFGGAVAGQHHNIYISDITYFNAILRNNIVRSTRNGAPVEAGWLNNMTRTVANASARIRPDRTFINGDAGSPALTVESGTNAVFSYGENTVHNINYVGDFVHIFGVFDVTITWSSGTSQFVSVTGFPVARDYAYIAVTGVNNGDIGFTSGNIPASFRMNIGNTGGAFFTEGEKTLRIDHVVSGKRLFISYDGWYRASP